MRPLDHHANLIGCAAAYVRGAAESAGDLGMTYDDDPGAPRSVAYDVGRNHGRGVRDLSARAWRRVLTWGADK